MIKYLNSFRKLLLLTLGFIFFSNTSFSQTYWDVDYNGQPMKEVVEVKYYEAMAIDTIIYNYYNDGKLKSKSWVHLANISEEDTVWTKGNEEYLYKGESLKLISSTFNGRANGVGKVTQTYRNIFPEKYKGYDSEMSLLKGDEPNVIVNLSYDKSSRIIKEKTTKRSDSLVVHFKYNRGELVSKTTAYKGEEYPTYYEVIEKELYGWEERKNLTDSTVEKRSFTLFADNELDDSKYAASDFRSTLDLEQIMKEYYRNYSGQKKADSLMAYLFVIGINIFENDISKIEEYGSMIKYFPFGAVYLETINYYVQNEQEELALDLALNGIKFFKENTNVYKEHPIVLQALYDKAAQSHEKSGNYESAFEYLDKVDTQLYQDYDPQIYLIALRRIRLLFLKGDSEKANQLLSDYKQEVYQDTEPNFDNYEFVSDKQVDSLDKIGEIYEIIEDFDKAAKYVKAYKDFVALYFGEASEEHIKQTERLIRLKRAALE